MGEAGAPPPRGDFARLGYAVVAGLIDPPLTAFLWSYVHTKFASRLFSHGDRLTPMTPVAYGDPAFDGLLEHLRPNIEAATGLRLSPTYSYFRLYKRGDGFAPHRDRPACEISISLSLGQVAAEPWPLRLKGGFGTYEAKLEPGDALLYRGCELAHWREPFEGERAAQVFLHYVDRDGPHAALKFDGRPTLMVDRPNDAGADG